MAEGAVSIYSGAVTARKRRHFLLDIFVRLIKEKPLGTVGAGIVLLLLFAGIFANWLAPYSSDAIWVGGRLEYPSSAHWMGTDNVGRDVFSRVIYGARVSMFVGLGVSALATVLNALIEL